MRKTNPDCKYGTTYEISIRELVLSSFADHDIAYATSV